MTFPWLRAIWDDEERKALAVPEGRRSWHVDGGSVLAGHPTDPVVEWVYDEGAAEHIALHDPAHELAEIDAKRRRLERHRPERRRLTLLDADGETSHAFYVCTACTPNLTIEPGQDVVEWPCPDIRDDAAVYSGNPGYRSEWRPA